MVEHEIDATFNTCPGCTINHGNGVKIGLVEACATDLSAAGELYPRRVFEEHQAFSHLTPTANIIDTEVAPRTCDDVSDCLAPGGTNACSVQALACIAGECVSRHASRVASVIAASDVDGSGTLQPRGAAKATLMMPNAQKINTTAGHNSAYAWLVNQGATIANESYGLGGPQTADYYAQYFGITPVVAAGNDGPIAVACQETANGICVGASYLLDESLTRRLAGYSHATNPLLSAMMKSDREEPDVVAFAGDTDVNVDSAGGTRVASVLPTSTTTWDETDGTSFAAPVVSSLLAHIQRRCGPLHPLLARAMIRTAAFADNLEFGLYSTPADELPHDDLDGAGYIDAVSLDELIGAPPECGSTGGVIDLTGGSRPQGETATYDPGRPSDSYPGQPEANYDDPAVNPNSRREYLIYSIELQVGDRIRWSLAWNACAVSPTSSSGTAPAIDLDLLLYKPDDRKYVFGSQSVDDNNEGFDYIITPDDGAGVYQVLLSRPAMATQDCNGATTLTYGSYGIVF